MTEYKIYSNPRVEPNDFSMDYGCSFCPNFQSKVIELPGTTLMACATCLSNFTKALNEAFIKDCLTEGEQL